MIRFIILALSISLVSSVATADLRSDMANSNLSLNDVIENALRDGMSPVQIAVQAISIAPEQSIVIVTALILATPDDAMDIVNAMIDVGVSRAELAATVALSVPKRQVEGILNMILDGAYSKTEEEQIYAAALSTAPQAKRELILALQRKDAKAEYEGGYTLTASYDAGVDDGGFSITRRLATDYWAAFNAHEAAVIGGDAATIAETLAVLEAAYLLLDAATENDMWLMSPS